MTPDIYTRARLRDGGCVGPRVGMPGACPPVYTMQGRIQLDHIATSGLGLRGPSTLENLVTLCQTHHRLKTEHARTWRPVLLKWTEEHS